MSGRNDTPKEDRAQSSDDPGDEAEQLTAAEAIEIQRQIQLEVQRFEAGMEG